MQILFSNFDSFHSTKTIIRTAHAPPVHPRQAAIPVSALSSRAGSAFVVWYVSRDVIASTDRTLTILQPTSTETPTLRHQFNDCQPRLLFSSNRNRHHKPIKETDSKASKMSENTNQAQGAVQPPVGPGPLAISGDMQAHLRYLANDPLYLNVQPIQIIPAYLDMANETNVRCSEAPAMETIRDARSTDPAHPDSLHPFSLDHDGFKFIHAPTSFEAWNNEEACEGMYHPEMIELIKAHVGGDPETIIIYAVHHEEDSPAHDRSDRTTNPFARQVHVSDTAAGIEARVRRLAEAQDINIDADALLEGRVRSISVWRPLERALDYATGLAVANGQSLPLAELVKCRVIHVTDNANNDLNPQPGNQQHTTLFEEEVGLVVYRPGFEW